MQVDREVTVAQEGEEPFELDEPATHSHTPPGWPIQTLIINPSGKAPKQHGPNTYRFGSPQTLSVLLPRRGWTMVKKTKNFIYLIPPAETPNPPFQISIAVPPDAECLAIANRSFARGESWFAQLGEWPAWYFHERNMNMQKFSRDPATGEMVREIIEEPPQSSLTMGEWGVWERVVTGIGGRFGFGHLPPDFVVPPIPPAPPVPPQPQPPMWEGAPTSVKLTSYERNRTARRKCIEHYGPTCQACTLNYEEKYGAIGAELIHVHHLTPLAEIGEAYEVDPICDLVPLCATCHHVVHSRVPPYSVDEIRNAIQGTSLDAR